MSGANTLKATNQTAEGYGTMPEKIDATLTVQSTSHLLLIEPAEFYANPETMDTNVYQVTESETKEEAFKKAISEFRAFRDMLVEKGVGITTVQGVEGCPDHIFPNWISTHENNKMIVYPMLNDNRRKEKTPEMIEFFKRFYDVAYDYSPFEERGQFLESTGSLNMDRVNKVAYVALSGRTDENLANFWGEQTGYDVITFNTSSHAGRPVYHTDLVMFIGTEVAGVCFDCIDEGDRERVRESLSKTHKIVELSMEQLGSYCGNSLEIKNQNGDKFLVMSSEAYNALTEEQKATYLTYFKELLHSPIPTIEKYGGGSARCLIMEMF
jgi:hypothetical protein